MTLHPSSSIQSPGEGTQDWRHGLSARAHGMHEQAVMRARAAFHLKLRLAYRIPYHEWQAAMDRKGPVGTFRYATDDLIEAYAPRFNWETGEVLQGPRCPPWATRRYRDGGHHA